ncbi:hypothetical protein L596_000301 [Steinernema carpocapsae]|uniref:Uncharacterized protein n=1 Tax=Steinernema carpocapsae TaxID=34508 RepID=A0A4U8UIK7_STECR|nr:hypothetical protein L596_000301 [Steinernema carpocapsae]
MTLEKKSPRMSINAHTTMYLHVFPSRAVHGSILIVTSEPLKIRVEIDENLLRITPVTFIVEGTECSSYLLLNP